jgi:hypothetical protein
MVDLLAVDASILDMLRCRNLIWLKQEARRSGRPMSCASQYV